MTGSRPAACTPHMLYPLPDPRPEGLLERLAGALHGRAEAGVSGHRAAALLQEGQRVATRAEALSGDAGARLAAWRAVHGGLRREGLAPAPLAEALAVAGAEAAAAWETAPGREDFAVALGLLRGMAVAADPGCDRAATVLAAAAAGGVGSGAHLVAWDPAALADAGARLRALAPGLGLSLGEVDPRSDPAARRAAYRADITCVPAQELVRDALEDLQRLRDRPGDLRLRLERLHGRSERAARLRQRGLVLGFLLDADVVLLDLALRSIALGDEADAGEEMRALALAWDVSGLLAGGVDYVMAGDDRPVLTARGRGRLAEMLGPMGGPWSAPSWREQRVWLALLVRHGLTEELHYFLRPGGVELVDAAVAPLVRKAYARRLLVGLLSVRHGLESPVRGAPVTSMSYMECFCRYRRLAGTLATADPATGRELWSLYRLPMVDLARPGPAVRPRLELVPSPDDAAEHVARRVADTPGRRVLVVTWNPVAGAAVAARLTEAGHAVTGPGPASGPEDGADVRVLVPRPGEPGADTSPRVGAGVPGLVLVLHPGPDRRRWLRLWRWLARAAPEADLCQVLALEDPRLRGQPWRMIAGLAGALARPVPPLARWLAARCVTAAIARGAARERLARREHRQVAVRLGKLLAFRGGGQ